MNHEIFMKADSYTSSMALPADSSIPEFQRACICALQHQENPNEPFLEWVKIAFVDFYSKENLEDLFDFHIQVAQSTKEVVLFHTALLNGETTEEEFCKFCIQTCKTLDRITIWNNEFRLRSYIDASQQAKILKILVEHLCSLQPAYCADRLALAKLFVQHQSESRPAFLLLGSLQLESGAMESAIQSAKAALALCGSCPTAQQLLFRAYSIQKTVNPNADQSDMAMYDLKEYFCSKPFDTLATIGGGEAFVCDCGGWLPYLVGNAITADSVDSVWNSEATQEIRRSIHDGTFEYCSRMLCYYIVSKTLPKKTEIQDPTMRRYSEERTVWLEESPQIVQLSHDATCNLACPSCRTQILTAGPAEREMLGRSIDRFILPLLKDVSGFVSLTGWGDPFSSPHYRSILARISRENYPGLSLALCTNGLLLTPSLWNQFSNLHNMLNTISVSIDAATQRTYEDVRRPGKWVTLRRNLDFIAKLRKENAFESFTISFVVQHANFREIPQFVELGLELDVDFIQFQKMWNFGHIPQDRFLQMDVASPGHPQFAELLEVLSNPLVKHEKVRLSNIDGLINAAQSDPRADLTGQSLE
jgi:wyosine [tRNA(Phe)-imidazoG37] synthetase (radical SAM superfamily)